MQESFPFHDVTTVNAQWRYQMEIFPALLAIVRGKHRTPVNSPHKGQCRGAVMFSLICPWINGWVNNREAGDLRRHGTHYDVTVIELMFVLQSNPWRMCCWSWNRTNSWSTSSRPGSLMNYAGRPAVTSPSLYPVWRPSKVRGRATCGVGVGLMVLVVFNVKVARLIPGLRPANERRRYKVTPSLIGWAQN